MLELWATQMKMKKDIHEPKLHRSSDTTPQISYLKWDRKLYVYMYVVSSVGYSVNQPIFVWGSGSVDL